MAATVGQIAGVGLGDIFVRGAHGGALRVDVGIVEIGLDQRAADGFAPAPRARRERKRKHARRTRELRLRAERAASRSRIADFIIDLSADSTAP